LHQSVSGVRAPTKSLAPISKRRALNESKKLMNFARPRLCYVATAVVDTDGGDSTNPLRAISFLRPSFGAHSQLSTEHHRSIRQQNVDKNLRNNAVDCSRSISQKNDNIAVNERKTDGPCTACKITFLFSIVRSDWSQSRHVPFPRSIVSNRDI